MRGYSRISKDWENIVAVGIPISGGESQSRAETRVPPKSMDQVVSEYAAETLTPSLSTLAKNMGKKLAGVRVAHEAACVEDARSLLRMNRDRTYPEFSLDMGGENVDYGEKSEPEDMHIGDVVNNHFGATPQPQPAPQPQPMPPQQATPEPSPQMPPPSMQPIPNVQEDLPFGQRIAKWILTHLPLLLAMGVIAYLIANRGQSPDYINVPQIDVTAP